MSGLLVAIHVMANLVWIGAIASVGWLTARAGALGPSERTVVGQLAYNLLYKRAAVPAFLVSFFSAVARLSMDPKSYFSFHWFHGKLAAALVVIALHHVIGAKARGCANPVASSSMQGEGSSAILTGALLATTFVTVVFAVLKSALVP